MTINITVPRNWSMRDLGSATTAAAEDCILRLDAVDRAIDPLPSSPWVWVSPTSDFSESLRAPFEGFLDAGLKDAAMRFLKTKPMADEAARLAAATLQQNVDMLPPAREAAVRTATTDLFTKFWQQTVAEPDAKIKSKAGALAKDAIEAGRTCKLALDKAVADFTGPRALRSGKQVSMDDLSAIVATRDELREIKPTGLVAIHETLVQSGDEDKTTMFERAVEPLLGEMAKLSLPKLAERLEMKTSAQPERNGGLIGEQQAAIAQLRRAIAAQEAARVPDSLKVCLEAYSVLVGVFATVFGYDARLIDRVTLDRRIFGGNGGKATDPFDVAPNWMARLLPSNAPVEASPLSPPSRSPWSK